MHIGEPKTGTTFLQRALWSNRARLAVQGVLLPGYQRQDHNRASRDLREAPRPASDPADPWTGEWDILAGQALLAPKTAVISDEVLAACNPPQADRAIRSLFPAEVHVILTVRDFATLLPAEWQETIKCRGTAGWEEWLSGVIDAGSADNRRVAPFWMLHDTLAILDMWSRHLPPDQVHVITMPRQGQDGTLWARFASVLGIDPGRVDLTGVRANSSLGIGEAEFLRRMNEALPEEMPDWFYTRTIKRVLAHDVLDARLRRGRLVVPPHQEAWVRQQSEILVAGLRESKFHVVGDLDELVPQPVTGPYQGRPTSRPSSSWTPPWPRRPRWRITSTGSGTCPGRGGTGPTACGRWPAGSSGPCSTGGGSSVRCAGPAASARCSGCGWLSGACSSARHVMASSRGVSAAAAGRRAQGGCSRRPRTRAGSPRRPGWTARRRR